MTQIAGNGHIKRGHESPHPDVAVFMVSRVVRIFFFLMEG
jgi:hypothetical protein